MANTLKIIKKSSKVFWHIHNEIEELKFAISSFDISIDGGVFNIIQIDGAKRYGYLIANISIIDETATSAVETFTTPEALYSRLRSIGYTAFKNETSIVSFQIVNNDLIFSSSDTDIVTFSIDNNGNLIQTT